jgi:hypothetical protein
MMKEDDDDEIGGYAEVDEFLLGGYSEGKRGRSLEDKQAVLIVAEKLGDGRTGKIGLKHIENFEADTLQCAIEQIANPQSNLRTDSYSVYSCDVDPGFLHVDPPSLCSVRVRAD